MDSSQVPEAWKNANVTAIYKKGSRAEAANYRPISLTSVASKLLGRIIHSHVMKHLEKHNILTDSQHGFRAKRSTETQLIQTIHDISKSLDKKEIVDMAILDFTKAFDKVPHKRLIHKLNYYGITGSIATWIETFLTGRTQQAVVNGATSSSTIVTSGIPQGTVLGPLLFLLYINDVPDNLSTSVRLFADDCILYTPIRTQNDSSLLQNDLLKLQKWQDTWLMKFNPDKCYMMTLAIRTPTSNMYTFCGQTLTSVTSHCYLGIHLSNTLNWTNQTKVASTKAQQTTGVIRRNLNKCPTHIKAVAYASLVRPILEYASAAWDPHSQNNVNTLERIQRQAARFCKNNYSREPGSVTKLLQVLRIARNYPKHITKLFAKCKYLSKHKHLPDGIQKWRTAQIGYMLAIQQFVYNRKRTILESGDCAAFYKYVNSQRVCREGVAPLMDAHGDLAVTAAQKAEALNGQFSSVFTMDDGNLPDFTQRSRVNLSDINLSAERVRKFMCMLPNKFSRSPDGIPSAVLKVLSYELCTPLYILFKMSIDSGTCPLQWKNADITPIYKKGDASQVSNYRPISILPAICRLFERILADDINFHLYHNRLITYAQYGFVKGRSTELQLLNCSKMWTNAIDCNKFVDTVYIDFSTVSHRKLLHKLTNYGITGNILQWFSSFLCDRKQRVKIGDVYSSYASVSSGVPQGSCTGPLLFILYANDLPDSHRGNDTMVCLFADDTKLSRALSTIGDRFELQESLNEFMNWAEQWQLRVAEHKCLVLSHGNCDAPGYYLKDVNLDNVDYHKDLGVIVDNHCLFKQHVSYICKKAYCSTNVLFRCFHTANTAALMRGYKSFIRPVLESESESEIHLFDPHSMIQKK